MTTGGAGPDPQRLAHEGRFVEAAEAAEAAGDFVAASHLWERACAFEAAAKAALAAGEAVRAAGLAHQAGAEALALAALERVPAEAAGAAAQALQERGAHRLASLAWERAGDAVRAARAAGQGGDVLRGAILLEARGDPRAAARLLEEALARDAGRDDVRVALGELLLRHGRAEAATRVLQTVTRDSAYRGAAARGLAAAFDALGLPHAVDEARREAPTLEGVAAAALPSGAARRLFGRYEVRAEVATSPWARVVRAWDTARQREVALKLFAAHDAAGTGRDAWARFAREVTVLGRLRHPRIVPVLDVIPEGPAFTMPWLPGGTLEARLAGPPLAPREAAAIAGALLEALAAVHRVGILHRDVKPANVLFDGAGAPLLSDFGVAHLGDASTTATAAVLGTRAYMSPEQRGGEPATVASDVYSVGAILAELLTGAAPGEDGGLTLGPSAAHASLDPRHDALVGRWLSPDPAARPESADAARAALTRLPWPAVARAAVAPADAPPVMLPERLATARGAAQDTWLERTVELVEAREEALKRARAFARAGHPVLQAVYRLDAGVVWLEALPETQAAALDDDQWGAVAEALEALHAEGEAHGAVGPAALALRDDGSIALRFATPGSDAVPSGRTPAEDHAALAALRR